ncbi:MAG: hypothetical protein ACRD1J_11675 [Terriglobia bacterium]
MGCVSEERSHGEGDRDVNLHHNLNILSNESGKAILFTNPVALRADALSRAFMHTLAQFALFITWFQMLTPGFRVGARALGKHYTEGIFKSRTPDGYDDVNLCVWK